MAMNLTKSQFRIYIEDRNKLLNNIYWEVCSGIGMTAASIPTSNGKKRFNIPGTPTPKNITISKAANIKEDALIEQWCNSFCADEPTIQGVNSSGAILMIVPLKPCMENEPYGQTCKVFDVQPIDSQFWDSDLMNTTDVSRVELQLTCSSYKFG